MVDPRWCMVVVRNDITAQSYVLANFFILSATLLFFVLIYVYFVEKLNSTNELKNVTS